MHFSDTWAIFAGPLSLHGKFRKHYNFLTLLQTSTLRRSETAAAAEQLLLYQNWGLRMRTTDISHEKLNHAHSHMDGSFQNAVCNDRRRPIANSW